MPILSTCNIILAVLSNAIGQEEEVTDCKEAKPVIFADMILHLKILDNQ
jgi:hypothetical protein